MKAKTKYGGKVAGVLVLPKTEVEILTREQVNAHWPNMKENPDSCQVAVQFSHLTTPTIVHISELVIESAP